MTTSPETCVCGAPLEAAVVNTDGTVEQYECSAPDAECSASSNWLALDEEISADGDLEGETMGA